MHVFMQDLQIVNLFYTVVCQSKSRDITLSVLYGYKAILQIVAILFAFSVRKVKIKGLDDTKYIVAAVFVTGIVTAVITVATYTLYDYSNALYVVLSSGFFIGVTITLLLVFIPKVRTNIKLHAVIILVYKSLSDVLICYS